MGMPAMAPRARRLCSRWAGGLSLQCTLQTLMFPGGVLVQPP